MLNRLDFRHARRRVWRKFQRVRLTALFMIGAFVLLGLVGFALFDSVRSARASEQQVRESILGKELSNFLLAVKEPDNTSLLDNPNDFSAAKRALSFVTLRNSFYTYLLNRANARTLTADKIVWEQPRPCIVEFSRKTPSVAKAPFTLQACFAVVPGEVSGRYAYFTLRYPTPSIYRHKPGTSLATADRVVLNFGSDRPVSVSLVFEPPTLAASRYPSQLGRFAGIHEVSAFLGSNTDRAARGISAQAFERVGDGEEKINFVTIVGRIDASMLDGQSMSSTEWPTRAISTQKIGVAVFSGASTGTPEEVIRVGPTELGESLVSLQKAYLSTVTKGVRLDIVREAKPLPQKVWSSADLDLPVLPRRASWIQRLFDSWASLTKLGGPSSVPVSVNQEHLVRGPNGKLSASLTAEPIVLPETVTRAFGWLTSAMFLILLIIVGGIYAVVRLNFLSRRAWDLARKNAAFGKIVSPYAHNTDEISRLGRILYMFFNAIAQRHIDLARRLSIENAAKSRDMRLMQAQLELRQASLDAIGHEIRSPLQSLLHRVSEDSDLYEALLRMQDGVEKIYLAATVEDGIGNREVICSRTDLADFLFQYAGNKSVSLLRYDGPTQGIWVDFDPIMFENVINHLIDNAGRYRPSWGEIVISLTVHGDAVVVEIFNHGPVISEELMPRLFSVGTTDRSTGRNRGLGLYASRAYLLGMKATISAENRPDGVAMVIVFPLATQPT